VHTKITAPCSASDSARSELNELLRQSGGGDKLAFSELYRRSATKLFSTCFLILRERSDSEEALQDSYVLIWRRSHAFDESKGSAMTWLLAITRNKAIDRLRSRGRSLPTSNHHPEEADEVNSSPVSRAEAQQEARNLHRCLRKLNPEHERSLREAFFSGASYRDIALRRHMPEGTMKAQIRRSLKELRISLNRLERRKLNEQ